MTVKELITELKQFPEDAEVVSGFVGIPLDKPYPGIIDGQSVVCITEEN